MTGSETICYNAQALVCRFTFQLESRGDSLTDQAYKPIDVGILYLNFSTPCM